MKSVNADLLTGMRRQSLRWSDKENNRDERSHKSKKRKTKGSLSETDGTRSQLTSSERKARRKEAGEKNVRMLHKERQKEAVKAAEAAARAATLAAMTSKGGASKSTKGFRLGPAPEGDTHGVSGSGPGAWTS